MTQNAATTFVLLGLAIAATFLAVWSGFIAFRAANAASPRDRWNAEPRTRPVLQAETMALGAMRDQQRLRATAFTMAGGVWWLAASACAAAASTTGASFLAFGAMTFAAGVGGSLFVGGEKWRRHRLEANQQQRIDAVDALERLTLDGARTPISIEQQLAEWASNSDLLVYVQVSIGRTRMTFRGRLHVDGWGYNLHASDWGLGPLDSTSPLRGVALNLHHYDFMPSWQPGNGCTGACITLHRRPANGGDSESLSLSIVDPFETFGPFAPAPLS